VQLSKDDSLVVMHDDRLDRTSQRHGPVKDHTYGPIAQAAPGRQRGHPHPLRHSYALGSALVGEGQNRSSPLDPKRGVPPERIVAAIREAGAEAYTVVITYTADQAARYHQLHPGLVLSVSVKQPADLRRLDSLGVPANRMLAFVGVSEPDSSLYGLLHEKGIYASLGTMGNLDRMAEARGEEVYRDLVRRGADVLSTDRPAEVAQAFAPVLPRRSSKAQYFREYEVYGNR
jgi:glycerophosphoryl diester phosphodiesterase